MVCGYDLAIIGLIYFQKHDSDSNYALISKRFELEPRIGAHSIRIFEAVAMSYQ